jgi:hypothetical protein
MRENSIFYPQPGNDATPVDRSNTFSRLVGNQLTVFYISIDQLYFFRVMPVKGVRPLFLIIYIKKIYSL